MKRLMKIAITGCVAIALSANIAATKAAEKDIVDTAVGAGSFKTLVAAVKAAGLVETLKGDGPFTVFAPTDEAFAKLPKGTVESLLKPENKDQLVAILTYHVVSGRVPAKKVVTLKQAKTVNGKPVKIRVEDGSVYVNKAKVIKTDIECSNGIIHVIDSVILPPKSKGDLSAAEARKLIEQAVAQGAHAYNAGHHDQCAKIYMKTMTTLVAHGDTMPETLVASMKQAVNQAAHTHCPTERSWTLRRSLDHAYARMAELK